MSLGGATWPVSLQRHDGGAKSTLVGRQRRRRGSAAPEAKKGCGCDHGRQ
ncbi:hypothetical protein HMPREF9607_00837 [Cutibacterium modestum HL044PA1]|uniref:Uncharacterized protein n=1 Tax=Cutibacterium modestum HL044PA1 TaxID=765109 RepID=A0ABP2K7U7_9ACTN|nr:hypothetical protein HMPREF9607_00837 [Cutibacterium modestum HL044PA1]